MSALSDACRVPFSNGTEGDAWMHKWWSYCANDHQMHGDGGGPGCDLILKAYLREWPGEAWLPEPDDGQFALPSRLCCLAFKPCEPCGGDFGADARAERIAEVTAYWKQREQQP